MRWGLAVAVAGMMLLAACGGDDGSGGGSDVMAEADNAARDYVEAVSVALRNGDERRAAPEADCMAEAIVEVVGTDALTDAGVSPEALGEADDLAQLDMHVPAGSADRLAVSFDECGLADDLDDAVVRDFSAENGIELSTTGAVCLYDNLDEDAVTGAVARRFVDGSDDHITELLVSALGSCPSVTTAMLLADMPVALSPVARECVGRFVEDNADLVARSLTPEAAHVGREVALNLAATCPELGALGD